MLRVIASTSSLVCDAFVRTLSLTKKEDSPIATIYQKGNTIFLLLSSPMNEDMVAWIADTFLPDRLYLPYSGYSLDVVHEIGDIIVPHTILTYDRTIEKDMITEQNRDDFIGGARFLTLFDEQKDYYVEDYGLSIGGIVVDGSPDDPIDELASKMMLAYEADIYTDNSVTSAIDIVELDEIPTVILLGIVRGKLHSKYPNENPYSLVAKNMMTTIKFMEDEEK